MHSPSSTKQNTDAEASTSRSPGRSTSSTEAFSTPQNHSQQLSLDGLRAEGSATTEDDSSAFGTDFWSEQVPQLVREHAAVQTASSAVHILIMAKQPSLMSADGGEGEDHYSAALGCFGQALREARQATMNREDMLCAILCSMFFAIFEIINGDHRGAEAHLSSGQRLMNEFHRTRTTPGPDRPAPNLRKELKYVLQFLARQAKERDGQGWEQRVPVTRLPYPADPNRLTRPQGTTPALRPPYRRDIPFWLAILLKKQRRANIVPPPWLHPESLRAVIHHETNIDKTGWAPPPPPPARADSRGNARKLTSVIDGDVVLSAPFLPSCTVNAPSGALPYHWFEFAEMFLAHASDDITTSAEVRSLLRDLQEVRAAKMRASTAQLEGGVDGVMSLRGVGAMELAESRGFVTGVVEGVRKIGASAEVARRDEELRGDRDADDDDASDEDMGF
ncbi:hypothetical protein S40288_02538 [Stachybotrys chartarum IBT 40288]|nr:hypothetical protein S40288_02538 [Stachybotrys chartarum IBT 40288]